LLTGNFSLGTATGRFVLVAAGGIAVGLIVGVIMRWVHRHLDDPPVQIMISLLTPFLAYLPAERIHVSGVLAVVTAGIFLGWYSPLIVTARYRLQAFSFWDMVVFLLNGFVFIAIGLQLPQILHGLRGESLVRLITHAAIVSAAAVLVRVAWVFIGTYLSRLLGRCIRKHEAAPGWRHSLIVAWAGMRGVVSLAAAFALPFTLSDGREFPARNYVLFLAFSVILATLVLQGLTLPILIRLLKVRDEGGVDEEERLARLQANQSALQLIERNANDARFPAQVIARLRAEYDERLEQLRVCADTPAEARGEVATPQYQQLQLEALRSERDTIIRLRNQHVINDKALRRIQRDLDLAEARLEPA
jgi:CPA1 family monovalent cation:H+ antiporter